MTRQTAESNMVQRKNVKEGDVLSVNRKFVVVVDFKRNGAPIVRQWSTTAGTGRHKLVEGFGKATNLPLAPYYRRIATLCGNYVDTTLV